MWRRHGTRSGIGSKTRRQCRHRHCSAWRLTTEYGYRFGGDIAGHIVGAFPHEQPADPRSLELDVHPDNPNDMFLRDANGNQRHWILELQFIDDAAKTGAYFEQLLC
jgi:hypothetical protein